MGNITLKNLKSLQRLQFNISEAEAAVAATPTGSLTTIFDYINAYGTDGIDESGISSTLTIGRNANQVRSANSYSTGKYYFEIQWDSGTNKNFFTNISTNPSLGMLDSNTRWNDGLWKTDSSNINHWGVMLDLDNRTMTYVIPGTTTPMDDATSVSVDPNITEMSTSIPATGDVYIYFGAYNVGSGDGYYTYIDSPATIPDGYTQLRHDFEGLTSLSLYGTADAPYSWVGKGISYYISDRISEDGSITIEPTSTFTGSYEFFIGVTSTVDPSLSSSTITSTSWFEFSNGAVHHQQPLSVTYSPGTVDPTQSYTSYIPGNELNPADSPSYDTSNSAGSSGAATGANVELSWTLSNGQITFTNQGVVKTAVSAPYRVYIVVRSTDTNGSLTVTQTNPIFGIGQPDTVSFNGTNISDQT